MLNLQKSCFLGLMLVLSACAAPLCAQTDDDPSIAPPTIRYNLASPRACILPIPLVNDTYYHRIAGAVNNFPRETGTIKISTGTRVLFSLSRQTEQVWYDHAYGLAANSLEMQIARNDASAPVDPCSSDVNWVSIGRDSAKDVRRGPSIGSANIKVPVKFDQPGIYWLKGVVRSIVQPYYPNTTDESNVVPPQPIDDLDYVYVRVAVFDVSIDDISQSDTAPDPETLYSNPMPTDEQSTVLHTDANGDGTVNLSDLMIMAAQWGQTQPDPMYDDPE